MAVVGGCGHLAPSPRLELPVWHRGWQCTPWPLYLSVSAFVRLDRRVHRKHVLISHAMHVGVQATCCTPALMRSAIHVQTGLCGALLACTLLALGGMGYTLSTTKGASGVAPNLAQADARSQPTTTNSTSHKSTRTPRRSARRDGTAAAQARGRRRLRALSRRRPETSPLARVSRQYRRQSRSPRRRQKQKEKGSTSASGRLSRILPCQTRASALSLGWRGSPRWQYT